MYSRYLQMQFFPNNNMKRIFKTFLKQIKFPLFNRVVGKIEKRLRFVISSVILTSLLLISTFFPFDQVWLFVPVFVLLSYFFTYFSLLEDIEKIEWTTLFIMPVIFTVVCYSFYFLFPVRWLTRVPYLFIYAVSMYALFLTSNIFNVGVEKSLRLYKAAFSVNYFYQTFLIFLSSNILFSLREYFIVNAIGVGVVSFALAMQLFWTIKLDLELSTEVRNHALFVGLLMAETALVLSFLPLQGSVLSLILASTYYSLGGLTSAHLDSRLFKSTVREYVVVLIFVWFVAGLTLMGW